VSNVDIEVSIADMLGYQWMGDGRVICPNADWLPAPQRGLIVESVPRFTSDLNWAMQAFTVITANNPPSTVVQFAVTQDGAKAYLTWYPMGSSERRYVWHTSAGTTPAAFAEALCIALLKLAKRGL